MNLFNKPIFSILGACLLTLATAHAATSEKKPERPASARVRRTTHHTEATAKWEMWSTQFKGSTLCVTPEEDASDDEHDGASAAPQTPKQKVLTEIEAYWASLITHQLYAQFRAPIMPEDFETEEDRAYALEDFEQAMEEYEEGIQEKALRQAKEAMAPLLYLTVKEQKRTHMRRKSSAISFESDFSEISFSGEPVRRASNMSGDGADVLDDFNALKEGLFALAAEVDALTVTSTDKPLLGGRKKETFV